MYQTQVKPKGCAADEELVEVLTAISVVSMRLARKLSLLAAQCKSKEGEKTNASVSVVDKGALDFAIRARMQCAVCRAAEVSYAWGKEDANV